MTALLEPDRDCLFCPRLVTFRNENRAHEPSWHNSPVGSFGAADAEFLVVGLAPGLRGANRTARPFTGDAAGTLLYPTLQEFGWATGTYTEDGSDTLQLINCRITNAVRCVPPQNRPVGAEIRNCQQFLKSELANMQKLRVILALGTVAHNAILDALDIRRRSHPFKHAQFHELPEAPTLVDSYHCSRYNVNTGRLTEQMFHDVFGAVKSYFKN
tara:strand:+ start:11399 stop:12040 length:642 start_codon:yes stop_codon:yes gene_type:complete